jgi:hypothetical protein
MIVTLPVITGTVNTAVHIVVGSMETFRVFKIISKVEGDEK